MKKLLVQQNKFFHYRKDLFNELSKFYEVTIIHSGEIMKTKDDLFHEIITPKKTFFGFQLQTHLFKEIKDGEYDTIILLFNLNYIANFLSLIFLRKKNYILWGPWVTGKKIGNLVRLRFMKGRYRILLYSNKHFKEFLSLGIDHQIMYIANNTINVSLRQKSFLNKEKNTLLFVGSFDERKKLDVLVQAFSDIKDEIDPKINLILVGNGTCFNNIQKQVKQLSLENRVEFREKITDDDLLAKEYEKAIVSISLGQAGLSVLQSFGFGVPFLTKENAISGGEIANIRNGYNGVLCKDDFSDLKEKLILLSRDITLARKMGENAYEYYDTYCTIENMAQGFIDALENSKEARVD